MKINITGRNISVSERTRAQIEKKFSKISKFFSDDTTAYVTLIGQKEEIKIEVTIPIKGSIIRAEETSKDLNEAVDIVEEVLDRQIRRHRTKLIDRYQGAESFSSLFIEDETEDDYDEDVIRIEKVKRFDFKPMSAEEACLEMDLLGHNFFVFRDAETNETCVVYKRKNNTYGLIEPEE